MSLYTTTADILTDAIFRAGENTDGSSDFAGVVLSYAQRAYQSIYAGGSEFDASVNETWWWLRSPSPGVLVLDPIREYVVSLTFGSTAITITNPPAMSLTGWWMAVSGFGDSFRIQSHMGSAAAATLDAPWTGDTGSQTVQLAHLDYDLAADVFKLAAPMWGKDSARIDQVDLGLQMRWPNWWGQVDVPDSFAQVTETTVRFNAVPSVAVRVEYDYLRRPPDLMNSASQEPLMPREYRKLLADGALFFLFVDKNDNRADTAGLLVKAGLKAMQREHRNRYGRQSFRYGQIIPRPEGWTDQRALQLGWWWPR